MTAEQRLRDAIDDAEVPALHVLLDATLKESRRDTLLWVAARLESRLQPRSVAGALRNAIADFRKEAGR